ncbi:MAG TPA: hypothetical protein VFQ45_18425 [Longimicrobium sp.]|nr:hypothetical protein [Longimicrobium sp.]
MILRDTVCIPQRDAGAPAELVPFVPAGSRALCSVAADLDRDGLYDWVMVTEPAHDDVGDSAVDDHPRTLLVLLRESGGALHQAVRNDRVVLCYGCGGSFDPFDALEAKAGMIKVYHFGGRGWRWRADYTFEYAPAVRTWRLAEVSEVEVHSGDPDNTMKQTRRGPRDFGEIDLAGFDPDMLLPPELR